VASTCCVVRPTPRGRVGPRPRVAAPRHRVPLRLGARSASPPYLADRLGPHSGRRRNRSAAVEAGPGRQVLLGADHPHPEHRPRPATTPTMEPSRTRPPGQRRVSHPQSILVP